MAVVKDSREYGWLTIARAEYEKLRKHGYAGRSEDGHYWVLVNEHGATCLYKGVSIEEAV